MSADTSLVANLPGDHPGRGSAPQSGFVIFPLFISAAALNAVAINLLVPSLPRMAIDLHRDYETMQFATSLFLLANAIGFLTLGALSDRYGRRPVLLYGLSLFAVASIVCALAPGATVLLMGRMAQGIGASSGVVLVQAMIRDRYDMHGSASAIGYLALGYGALPMLAPLIGGIVGDHFGWRANFVLLALIGALTAFAAYAFLSETRRHVDTPLSGFAFHGLVRLPAFWAFTLAYTFSTGLFFCFLAGTSFAARFVLDMSGATYGLLFVVVNLGYSFGAFLTGHYVRRVGITPMIIAGGAIGFAAVLAMTAAFAAGDLQPAVFFIPMLIINFGNGLMQSNAIASVASVRPEWAGAASGLAGALQVTFSAIAVASVGFAVAATGSQLAFAFIAMLFAAGGLSAAIWARSIRKV